MTKDDAVEAVAVALFKAWFPNGHGGVDFEPLREDFDNWVESATDDAVVAVSALIDAGLLSGLDSVMIDSMTKDERNE